MATSDAQSIAPAEATKSAAQASPPAERAAVPPPQPARAPLVEGALALSASEDEGSWEEF